jgi:hypothetical protein
MSEDTMKPRKQVPLLLGIFLLTLILSPVIGAQKSARKDDKAKKEPMPAEVWRDPGDVSALDLFYGPGGRDHAPDPNGIFTFVKEDMNGTSPKFDVQDDNGLEWRVKLGEETQSETAATRLLWAAGYCVDEDYYLAALKVRGLPKLRRGQSWVSADGTVHHARLELRPKNIDELGSWDWYHNECGPAKEWNGLRIMMAFVNNLDLKAVNNTVEAVSGQRRCVVTDVGVTFGKTGNSFTRSASVEKDYIRSKFITKATPESVDFVMHSRPFFLTIFNLPGYRARTRMEKITKHIPLADAKWLGQRLTLLSVHQIHDCFRAAGYTPEEVDGYTRTVQNRITELNELRAELR